MLRRATTIAALALSLPATAHAATVTVDPGPLVRYAAAPGELNRLTLTYGADGSSVTVADPGATIAVDGGCSSLTDHTALCEVERELITELPADVALGDGDDTLRVFAPGVGFAPLTADGGVGDDELHGGSGFDFLAGGPGDDILAGAGTLDAAGGHDELVCAGRDDVVLQPAADVVLDRHCERVRFRDGFTVRPAPTGIGPRALRLRYLTCPCGGRLRLTSAGQLLGEARPSGAGSVRVVLTQRGRTLLAADPDRSIRASDGRHAWTFAR